MRDFRVLTVTLPGAFLAEPCDRIAVSLPSIGLHGTLRAGEVISRADRGGVRCTIELREEIT